MPARTLDYANKSNVAGPAGSLRPIVRSHANKLLMRVVLELNINSWAQLSGENPYGRPSGRPRILLHVSLEMSSAMPVATNFVREALMWSAKQAERLAKVLQLHDHHLSFIHHNHHTHPCPPHKFTARLLGG